MGYVKVGHRTTEWFERPPVTARMARKIWDLIVSEQGYPPNRLWKNGNGIVFGKYSQSGADYGAWKCEFLTPGGLVMGSIPRRILDKVGAK